MEFITHEEVTDINKSITSCYIENPINIYQDIVVEIYYEYINLQGNLKNNGVKVFKSATKAGLIAKIKGFFSILTSEEVLDIHDNITDCIIENPNEINDGYYVKIFFKYLKVNGEENTDGRKEFISESKTDLLKEVKNFITNFKTTKIMPKYETVYFNGSGYVVSTTIEPIIGDYAICRSMFDDNPIVKVIANDGVYISYLVNNEVVQHPLSCTSKIMASTDKSLGLPDIQEEMLPYVEFVELTIKLWAAKEDREFYVTCEYDALDDIIVLHADNHIGISWEMLIFKARGKFMLTNIKIENGEKKKVSTTEYDRLLMLLGEIFNL